MKASQKLAMEAVAAACSKKGLAPVLLDVSEQSSYTDYILVLSGTSVRQVEAISEGLQRELKAFGYDALGSEGARGDRWRLLDYGDVIIHIFHHPLREYYDLEGLWSEAPRVQLDVPEELRRVPLYSGAPSSEAERDYLLAADYPD